MMKCIVHLVQGGTWYIVSIRRSHCFQTKRWLKMEAWSSPKPYLPTLPNWIDFRCPNEKHIAIEGGSGYLFEKHLNCRKPRSNHCPCLASASSSVADAYIATCLHRWLFPFPWASWWRSRAWGGPQSQNRCEILKINTSLMRATEECEASFREDSRAAVHVELPHLEKVQIIERKIV